MNKSFFTCKVCLRGDGILELSNIIICGRHTVNIFVDGVLKYFWNPSEIIEKELQGMDRARMVERVVQLENKKKQTEAEESEVPPLLPLLMKPLGNVLEKEDGADVVEDTEGEVFLA